MADAQTERIIVSREELLAFLVRSLEKGGASSTHAHTMSEMLVESDYRGHYSHGLSRLAFYMKDLSQNLVASQGQEPEVIKETAATALVDGKNVMGAVTGTFCMELAIRKAREAGIGWVSARGSNHFGIAGWYGLQASKQGMLGMAFTNTSPRMVPTRAQREVLGTNPLAVVAPANNGDNMYLDMATTNVAFGKVALKKAAGEQIPLGWGVDQHGKPCPDPETVMVKGGLMPLGGPEETSGYKGYGLAMMVDVFCGILSGGGYGHRIRHWTVQDGNANMSHCFVAIDPEAFAPGFTDRMTDLLDYCRALDPAEGESEVLVPGDKERQHMSQCDAQVGISYPPSQVHQADKVAEQYGIQPLVRLA